MAVLSTEFLGKKCWTCTARQKIEWGCTERAIIPCVVDGEDQWECPSRYIRDRLDEWFEMLEVYRWAKQGHFPDQGTWYDQTNGFRRLIAVLDSAAAELEELRQE